MKNIKFSSQGKITFYFSFAVGTILLLGFLLTQSEPLLIIGFYYVLVAAIINIIIFFHELIFFITNVSDNKSNGNSAVLILLNVPISIIYFLAVINCFNL